MSASRLATIAFILLVSCTQEAESGGDAGRRPSVYSARLQQFGVDAWRDARVITITRAGAGSARRAEYSVFELVDGGRRLARLHQRALRDEYGSPLETSFGMGRFLITASEGPSNEVTENALVLYDFVRGVSVAWKMEEFVPADMVGKLPGVPISWYVGPGLFDTQRLLFYPNDPDRCRERGYPFLAVDVLSRSVQVVPVPDHLGPEVVRPWPGDYTLRWSMGGASEPPWNVPFLLPMYVLAVVAERHGYPEAVGDDRSHVEKLAALGLVDGEPTLVKNQADKMVPGWQTCFKLDSATGDYVRCPLSEWVERGE